MENSADVQQLLLEIIMNKVRIFPPSDDADYTTIDGKKIDGLDPIALSQIGVESTKVSFGEGGFDIEVVLFDPSMTALDVLIYGVPFQDNKIKITLGWYDESDSEGNKRVFEGNLISVRPEVVAGGVRYTLNYFYSWVVYGSIKNDNAFVDILSQLYDDGHYIIKNHVSLIGRNAGQYTVRLEDFTVAFSWGMIENLSLLVSFGLVDSFLHRYGIDDVTINVNGKPIVLFDWRYTRRMHKLLNAILYWKKKVVSVNSCRNTINDLFSKYVFPKIGRLGLDNYDIKTSTNKDRKVESVIISRSVCTMYVEQPKFKLDPIIHFTMPDFSGSINVVHLTFIFAALYGLNVEIEESLLNTVSSGVDIESKLTTFIQEKVMPLSYMMYKDARDSNIQGLMSKILFDIERSVKAIIHDDVLDVVVDCEGLDHDTATYYSKAVANAYFAEVLFYITKEISNRYFANIDANVTNVMFDWCNDHRHIKLNRDQARAFRCEHIKAIGTNYSYFFPQKLYDDSSYYRSPGEKILELLKKLFRDFGLYSPNGFGKSITKEDPELLNLFIDMTPGSGGKGTLKIGGEYVNMRMTPTHIYSFPRQQATDESVIGFTVTSDGSVFLPFYGGLFVKDFSTVSSGIVRNSKSTDFKPSVVSGENVTRLFSDVNLDKIRSIVERTEDINQKIKYDYISRKVISRLIYPFFSSHTFDTDKVYDLASYVTSVVNFQKVGLITVEMEVLGNPALDMLDYIFTGIITPDYTLHHLSGVYMITHIEHFISGAAFTTKLLLRRMGTYNIGAYRNIITRNRRFAFKERK